MSGPRLKPAPFPQRSAPAPQQDHAKAARELVNSRTLRLALSIALAAGNFLNHGSRLGAAAGFRLKSLNKLADSRSGDGKSTLLQAVAKEVVARLRKEADGSGGAAAAARANGGKGDEGKGGDGAGSQGAFDCPLLVDEVPHVVSSRLKTSLADAAELGEQVGGPCQKPKP
jgi:hypothetical protein